MGGAREAWLSSYHVIRSIYMSVMMENSVGSGAGVCEVRVQKGGKQLPEGKTSAFWAIFLVVNAALGAGLLVLPLSFYMTGGIVYGILIELVRNESGNIAKF